LALIENDKEDFDLILLDIEMPDVSGFEFLHTIRKIPRYMTKPIVIVTGHSDSDILAHAENSSASGVLIKPVESGQLHGAVEKALCTPAKKPFDL
jgi:CheY-like chemotaxis protein